MPDLDNLFLEKAFCKFSNILLLNFDKYGFKTESISD